MLMTDIIAKKRDGKALSPEEINYFITGAANATIPDYQLTALLMAIYLKGMSQKETADMAFFIAKSGEILDLSNLGNKTVDKHSTGGVGDKTTLICAPLAAAMGCTVAKLSGRGLGHTGGTVDKLESIIGYNISPSLEKFIKTAEDIGICLASSNQNLAPADKKLYSLRDVTSTVDSIPLIASSIMGKKIASGAKNIILDVKFGSGAFMKNPEDAEKLACEMVKIGNSLNKNTIALITDMDIPLGKYIGNALEIKEAADILKSKGDKRLCDLCLYLAAAMHSACFKETLENSLILAEQKLKDGSGFEKLCETVTAMGGDARLLTGEKDFPKAKFQYVVHAQKSGFISSVDSFLLGKTALLCGAGRKTAEDKIDYSAGIELLKQYGDYVNQNEPVAILYGETEKVEEAKKIAKNAFIIQKEKPLKRDLIYKIIKEV